DYGVDKNPIVLELIGKYDDQKAVVMRVSAEIESIGLTCKKEYVKGRENLVHNPLLDVYQKHQDSLSRTLDSLTDAIIKFGTTPARKNSKLGALDDED
ncbi:MAG: hypothetical protein MJ099_04850, partial [Clostridia bacterium]|nr:hypothetical protein [Clostridia bacterium]